MCGTRFFLQVGSIGVVVFVAETVSNPLKDFRGISLGSANVISAIRDTLVIFRTKKILFSSCGKNEGCVTYNAHEIYFFWGRRPCTHFKWKRGPAKRHFFVARFIAHLPPRVPDAKKIMSFFGGSVGVVIEPS